MIASGLATMAAAPLAAATHPAPFAPDWASLAAGYRVPDWFRDAKFGIWSHWSAQCVPEFGDWYGRLMYVQGHPTYDHHLKHYGHPSRTGFLEIENLWKAEHWRPEELIQCYQRAGAHYFMALGCHHDNLDTFASRHHAWNTLRVGPRRDIVAGWAQAARAAGLKFGISNHSSHAWHWWQTAYGYDSEGPMRGARYDAYRLTKTDGRGKWWDGLDPQELYTGRWFVPPDGIDSIAAMNAWHDARDGQWLETAPPGAAGAAYARQWLARQQDLVEQYRPDCVYLDDSGLPFGPYGLAAAAHYYNEAARWHGHADVALFAKQLAPGQERALVEDVERGFSDHLRPVPWQTDTCIGNWHYDRRLFDQHAYKTARMVVQRLCDVVAKNGNLLLSIPIRADGTHDSDELAILDDLADWFAINGAAIYGTRPWRSYGEGPTRPVAGVLNEATEPAFTAAEIRFTVTPGRDGALHAFVLDAPQGEVRIAALGVDRAGTVTRVSALGAGELRFR
jgi:alpha-L-fucosidase